MEESTKEEMKDHSRRFGGWWIISLVALVWIMWTSPENGQVLIYKLAMVTVGLLLAYWADKVMFSHALEIELTMKHDTVGAARLLCRALITVGVLHALASGI